MTEQLAAISLPESDFRERNREEFGFPYKFSIVMSVYNVEEYINEAVDSIIKQNIGFEGNVQIVFVDDGSQDRSGEICEEYRERFPQNIVVIHKENGGLSSARNEGLKHVEGRYVNFFDPDDRLSLNTLRNVYNFFSAHDNEIDIVSIPLYVFGDFSGGHLLNYKFKRGTRIINLHKEYSQIQLSAASAFIKKGLAVNLCFDSELVIAEDAKEILKILGIKFALGVVSNCKYWYRRRIGSQVTSGPQKSAWYIKYLQHFSYWAKEYFETNIGYFPLFAQYTVMYDLQSKLCQDSIPSDVLSPSEIYEYRELLTNYSKFLDNRIILEQKNLFLEHKLFFLSCKYGKEIQALYMHNDILFHLDNTNICWNSELGISIDFISIKHSHLYITGSASVLPFNYKDLKIILKVNDMFLNCDIQNTQDSTQFIGETICLKLIFKVEVPLTDDCERYNISFHFDVDGNICKKPKIVFKNYSPIDNVIKSSYYKNENWCLTHSKGILVVKKCSLSEKINFEYKLLKELYHSKEKYKKKAIVLRGIYWILKSFKRKELWLISDKANRADDNGEAFFTYLASHASKNIKCYFVISKTSADYHRIRKMGKVIPHLSWRHKLAVLLSDEIISAYSHVEVTNPFYGYHFPYKDILSEKSFVFLQHGVTYNDISKSIGKYKRNIKLIVASSPAEKEAFISPRYGYTENNISLAGFPRYDFLKSSPKRIISIAPTWRRYLFNGFIPKEDRWVLKPEFNNSNFYKSIMYLVNNERLISAAQKYNYSIYFVPHSVFFPYIDQFKVRKEVNMFGTEVRYRDIFNYSDLLITDYSSIAFDFAYLRKPLIYAQFDKDEFYLNHGYQEGYFSIEKDGFGEIEYDLESTIDRIIEYMETGCQLKDVYRERIDNFFAFNDQDNCKRVYEAVKRLSNDRNEP